VDFPEMDTRKSKANGLLKNGLFEEHFKDGTLSSVGEYIEGEKTGEWNELAQRIPKGNW